MRWRSSILAWTLFGAAVAQAAPPGSDPAPTASAALEGETDDNRWPVSLSDATRIALDNSEAIRLIAAGPPLRIARINADVPDRKFRADAAALVRSVEQQYWALAADRARAAAAEQAARTAADIIKREQAEPLVSHGTVLDLAEAAQFLERLEADRKLQKRRVADDDRRLRLILNLPPLDGRWIVTTTRPIDRPIASDRPSGDSRVDAGHRRYQEATRHRIDAARRIEKQKQYYEEGRITTLRYLEEVHRHAEAVAAEADRASEYNTSIAAMGEAKGTLLADRTIEVVEPRRRMPRDGVAGPAKRDEAVSRTSAGRP